MTFERVREHNEVWPCGSHVLLQAVNGPRPRRSRKAARTSCAKGRLPQRSEFAEWPFVFSLLFESEGLAPSPKREKRRDVCCSAGSCGIRVHPWSNRPNRRVSCDGCQPNADKVVGTRGLHASQALHRIHGAPPLACVGDSAEPIAQRSNRKASTCSTDNPSPDRDPRDVKQAGCPHELAAKCWLTAN